VWGRAPRTDIAGVAGHEVIAGGEAGARGHAAHLADGGQHGLDLSQPLVVHEHHLQ